MRKLILFLAAGLSFAVLPSTAFASLLAGNLYIYNISGVPLMCNIQVVGNHGGNSLQAVQLNGNGGEAVLNTSGIGQFQTFNIACVNPTNPVARTYSAIANRDDHLWRHRAGDVGWEIREPSPHIIGVMSITAAGYDPNCTHFILTYTYSFNGSSYGQGGTELML